MGKPTDARFKLRRVVATKPTDARVKFTRDVDKFTKPTDVRATKY